MTGWPRRPGVHSHTLLLRTSRRGPRSGDILPAEHDLASVKMVRSTTPITASTLHCSTLVGLRRVFHRHFSEWPSLAIAPCSVPLDVDRQPLRPRGRGAHDVRAFGQLGVRRRQALRGDLAHQFVNVTDQPARAAPPSRSGARRRLEGLRPSPRRRAWGWSPPGRPTVQVGPPSDLPAADAQVSLG